MHKILSALTLLLLLGCPVPAREIPNPPSPAGVVHIPPAPQGEIHNPTPTDTAQDPAARGDIQNGQPGAAAVIALSLFRGVLGLF